MDCFKGRVTKLLVDYFEDDFRRITHALEIIKQSEKILENTESYDHDILIASALLHDISIKKSEAVLGYNNGKAQEEYGPPLPRNFSKALTSLPRKLLRSARSLAIIIIVQGRIILNRKFSRKLIEL
ncbi:phosphohydrolase [Thermodesulfobacteriota bacterium]